MQLKHFFIAGLLIMITFASCSKKSNNLNPVVTIEGNWVGKYSVLSGPYNNFYSFKLKAGGVLEFLDAAGQKTGGGIWGFSNANIIISGAYTLLPPASGMYSFIGNFNSTSGELDGTWGNGQKEYGGGYWFMNKVK